MLRKTTDLKGLVIRASDGELGTVDQFYFDEETRAIRYLTVDSHWRSAETTIGFHIEARDGEIGHVDEFPVDDQAWAIRYMEVATRNWWPGKKVLVSAAWIERVGWTNSKVYTALSRESIQTAPEYSDSVPLTREAENLLYFHYGRPPIGCRKH
jgi:hypothetical protein